jgi:hypothetical protein
VFKQLLKREKCGRRGEGKSSKMVERCVNLQSTDQGISRSEAAKHVGPQANVAMSVIEHSISWCGRSKTMARKDQVGVLIPV